MNDGELRMSGLFVVTLLICNVLVKPLGAQRFNLVTTRFVAAVGASIVTTLLLALVIQTVVIFVPPGGAPPLQLTPSLER